MRCISEIGGGPSEFSVSDILVTPEGYFLVGWISLLQVLTISAGVYSLKTCFATACTASLFGPLQGLYDTRDYPYYSECVASPKLAGDHQSLLFQIS